MEFTEAAYKKCAMNQLTVCSVGAGYVGSLTTLTMASLQPQTHFTCCDINTQLIQKWQTNKLPFYEPELKQIYEKVTQNGNLVWTTNVEQAILKADIVIICVNTPPKLIERKPLSSI